MRRDANMPVTAPPVGGKPKKLKPGETTKTHHTTEKAKKPSLSEPAKAFGRAAPMVIPAPPSGGGTGKPKKKGHPLTEEQRFLWAEGEQESGNNYSAENPTSGALGRWQVMPGNLPVWLPESGQRVMSPSQFLANHAAQNAVANTILGGYFRKYGAAGAAAMWYSGQPDPGKTYGDPPVYVYVDDVLKLMGSKEAEPISISGTSVLLPWQLPKVEKTDSWSTQVRGSAAQLTAVSKSAKGYATAIQRTYIKI
jgi:hypothetical protein